MNSTTREIPTAKIRNGSLNHCNVHPQNPPASRTGKRSRPLEWLQILHFLDENFRPPRHGTHATWRHLSPTLPALAIRMNGRRLHPQCKNAPTNWRGCIGLAPLLYMTTGSQELAPPPCGQYAQKKTVDCDLSSNCQSNAFPRNPNTSNERDLLETTFFWSGSWAACLPTWPKRQRTGFWAHS